MGVKRPNQFKLIFIRILIESKKILNEKIHVPRTKNLKTNGLILR